MATTTSLDPRQIVSLGIRTGFPLLLMSDPGMGKTAFIEQLAEKLGRNCVCILPSASDPTDFGGFPKADGEGVRFVPPAWAVNIVNLHAKGKKSVIFIDELTTVPPSIQAPLLQITFAKKVGELQLPMDTMIIAAGNPPSNAANGQQLAAPLANRMCHLEWRLSVDDWIKGFMGDWEWDMPEVRKGWEKEVKRFKGLVGAYISKVRDTRLYGFPSKERSLQGGPWSSGRTWEAVAQMLAVCDGAGLDVNSNEAMTLVRGCVGPAAATEFMNWVKALDLPDPEELLKDPKGWDVASARNDIVFAALSAAISCILNKNTSERWMAGWALLEHVANANKAEVGAVAATTLLSNRPKNMSEVAPLHLVAFYPMLSEAGKLKF